MFRKKLVYFVLVISFLQIFLLSEKVQWKKLEKGLDWKIFQYKKNTSEKNIYILRIDPDHFSFELLTAQQKQHSPLSIDKWCKKYKLIAGINASMYLPDRVRSTGYMKNYDNVNNKVINKRFGAFIAFNPKNRHLQKVKIIDKYSPRWKEDIDKYNTLIQNYRIIDTGQNIVWTKYNNRNSIVAFGIDSAGKALLIICREKISTYSFAKIIKNLPVNIYNLTYLEGGREASLFINHNKLKINLSGKLFDSQKENSIFGQSKLPNIIGIRKR